jgi:hypothetical protein
VRPPHNDESGPKAAPKFDDRDDDEHQQRSGSRALALVPRIPFDCEAELAVLAELADPKYRLATLANISTDDFYDHRHRRCFTALRGEARLSGDDTEYLQHAVHFAWPLSANLLSSFIDCAARRRELAQLEARRLELLGVTW